MCMFLIAIAGCATGGKVVGLSPGMSQADVVGTLGRPDGFKTEGYYTTLKYTNKLILFLAWMWEKRGRNID